jgi:hypothetical protein
MTTRGYKAGESLFEADENKSNQEKLTISVGGVTIEDVIPMAYTSDIINRPYERDEVVYCWHDLRSGVKVGYFYSQNGDAYYVRTSKTGLSLKYSNISRTNPL